MFTFGEGDLARGCVGMQLLIRSGAELMPGCQMPSMRISRRSASEGGEVPSVYTSDCKGVLFMHEFVGALLPFSGKVAIGEMVAVKALVGLHRRSDQRRRGRSAVSVRCILRWKRGLPPR